MQKGKTMLNATITRLENELNTLRANWSAVAHFQKKDDIGYVYSIDTNKLFDIEKQIERVEYLLYCERYEYARTH